MNSASRRRRERERVETRQKILDAARDLFVRKGYEATTMRAIAERVEYTPTAIYHHFESKEALVAECCAGDWLSLTRAVQRIATGVEDPIERLAKIGAAYVDFALEYPMQYHLMFMTARPVVTPEQTPAHLTAAPDETRVMVQQTAAEAIESGRLRPEYTDPDEIWQMVWGTVHGIVSLHIAREHAAWVDLRDPRTTATRAVEALLRGLQREPR